MTPVETSAVVGILLDEPDAEELLERVTNADMPVTLVTNAIEASLSIGRHIRDYTRGGEIVSSFLAETKIQVLPVTEDFFQSAVEAYALFGKGTGSRAKLNFGDCLSYVMAKRAEGTLIFKGNDFSKTDLFDR